MNNIFHISRLIIKKKLKVLSDSEKSQLNQFNKDYPFSKQINFENLVDKIDNYSTIDKDKAWEAIKNKSEKKHHKPVFQLFKKSWHKYTAAAILIGVLASNYFFKDNLFSTKVDTNPIIVNNNIEVGIDKATLTLEDGKIVALEKGQEYISDNVQSNGKELIYNAKTNSKPEIVYNYLTIPRGGQFFIKLSDGTQVWLNSESQLKYPVSFKKGETRQVELVYGEAYFDVSPSTEHNGSKFKVNSQTQEIEVLGTAFNIKAYKDETSIYTTLVEGKVALNFNDTRQNLIPSQQSVFNLNTNSMMLKMVDVYNEVSWKDGIFSFEKKPLKDIMKVVSRWYDFEVIFINKAIEEQEFIGVLGKNQNIEEILKAIQNFGVIKTYKINNKTVILK